MKQISKWPNGNIREEGRINNGLKEGLWKDYYEDGATIRREVLYKNGQENGSWKSFWPDGSLMWEGVFRNGKFLGSEKEINQLLNDEPEGWWEIWDEGSLIRAFYKNGKREGYCEDYPVDEIMKGFYTNDLKEGFFSIYSWWDDEDREEAKEPWDIFIAEEGYYKDGKKQGLWKFYFKSGKLKKEGSFEKGKEVGLWKSYSNEGKCILKSYELKMSGEMDWDLI